jgi:hypothetical protein
MMIHQVGLFWIRTRVLTLIRGALLPAELIAQRYCFLFQTLIKEVIQPHLPVRLPCYDFTLVTSPAVGIPLQPRLVRVTTLGMASSHGVTGGVYKARERIHRSMADLRLLAIPTSCRRVSACNLN